MKITKRILAVLLPALMLLSTCAVAAAAAQSLQSAIDAAAAGSTVTMPRSTTESVVIRKDRRPGHHDPKRGRHRDERPGTLPICRCAYRYDDRNGEKQQSRRDPRQGR